MQEVTTTTVTFPSTSQDALSEILRQGAQQMLTTAIEAEVAQWIDSHGHLQDERGHRQVVRNGYLPERQITTGIGPVKIRQPRVADRRTSDEAEPFSSKILPPYLRKTRTIEELLPWLYLKGISTGDFHEALQALVGPECPGLSASTITRLLEGWALGDQYLISLSDTITDVEGDRLDGEWTNPASLSTTNPLVSTFPSGNGNGGGDFNFIVTLLPGDANLDLIVNSADAFILYQNLGATDALFINADFDGNGVVNTPDGTIFSQYNGTNLQNVWILADLNGDLTVDQSDVDILFANLQSGLQNPTWADGDLDGDGQMTTADLDLMFAQYGLELALVA